MTVSKRLLVLAGCALILVGCTQDTTTAPPVATDIGVAAVTETGSEGGTITLLNIRGDASNCAVKMALNTLVDDGSDATNYLIYLDDDGIPPDGMSWNYEIGDLDIARNGSARVEYVAPRTELWNKVLMLSYRTETEWLSNTLIGRCSQGPGKPCSIADTDFKINNRCN